MDEIITRLQDAFSPARAASFVATALPNVLVALATMLVFGLIWLGVKRLLPLLGRTHLDETARSFIEQVVKYTIFTFGLVSALGQLGVNTASLITSLGVAGLTIGFAARDTLSNLISGLFIFWDRPFVVGDLVEVGGQYGRVAQITLRSTRIVTVDGRMLAVPNAQIVNSTVASYTNFPHLRLDIDVTIGVEESLGRVRELLLALVHADARFRQDGSARVVVTALNDYNVALQLQAWILDEREHIALRFELRERVFETLREAGVDMPFETLRLLQANDANEAG